MASSGEADKLTGILMSKILKNLLIHVNNKPE